MRARRRCCRRCSPATNFVLHAAGWMEGGLSASYEKFVMDFDQLGAMHVLAKGVDLSENGQAMEAFHQVEPGGHFLGCAHTQANFETAFYRSNIADNNSVEQWMEEGSKDAATRANALWKKMLADYAAAADRSGRRRGAARVRREEEGVDAGRQLLRRGALLAMAACGAFHWGITCDSGSRGRHRRRRRRRLHALSSRQEGLERQRAHRAQGADLRLDLARRRACCRCSTCPIPSANCTNIRSGSTRRSSAETGLDVGFRQVSNIRLARTQDRLDEYKYYAGVARDDRRHRGQVPHARRGQGDLAALQHRRHARRDPASAGRLYPARRSDAGAGARRARARRRDQPQHHRHRDRAAAERRMEGRHRQGRDRLRARDLGDRQFRAPDRRAWSGSTCR